MPLTAEDWADAYLKQAKAEWRVWNDLRNTPGIPECVRLHVLQMSMEKLGKAHRLRQGTTSIEDANKHHVAFEKTVSAILSARAGRIFQGLNPATVRFMKPHLRELARDIERLCPAVDKVNTASNSEYPWESGGQLFVPVDYPYTEITRRLMGTDGMRMMKVIDAIFAEAEG